MPISFVGSKIATGLSGANVAVALNSLNNAAGGTSAAQADDFCVLIYTIASNQDRAMSVSEAGWTEQTELFRDTGGSDLNFAVYTKRMGATPDTTVTCVGDAFSESGVAAAVIVFRGVDATTPLDVALATATGTTGKPDPPAATPSTAGAWIVVCGGAAANDTTALGNPGDLSSGTNHFASAKAVDTKVGYAAMGFKSDWTSGSFDPLAFTGGGTSAVDHGWGAATLVLRPSSGSALVVQGSVSASASSSPALSPKTRLAPAASVSASALSTLTISPRTNLAPAATVSSTISDSPKIFGGLLEPVASVSASLSPSVIIATRTALAVQDGISPSFAEALGLSPRTALLVDTALSGTLSPDVAIRFITPAPIRRSLSALPAESVDRRVAIDFNRR